MRLTAPTNAAILSSVSKGRSDGLEGESAYELSNPWSDVNHALGSGPPVRNRQQGRQRLDAPLQRTETEVTKDEELGLAAVEHAQVGRTVDRLNRRSQLRTVERGK